MVLTSRQDKALGDQSLQDSIDGRILYGGRIQDPPERAQDTLCF